MFDSRRADRACNFFEMVLRHSADQYWGKPFILAPWEEEALRTIYGNVNDDGLRIIEQVYLEVPKKSGKTEFAAGIILLELYENHTPGFQVYGAAAATRQALNVYRAAAKMWEQAPILQRRFKLRRGTNKIISRADPETFYAAIAADGDFGDGVNPAVNVCDEIHRWKTRKQLENWDVLVNGGVTRKQTLTIAITTAGVQDESPLAYSLHQKTRNIRDGIVSDPTFYGRVYGADSKDDPGDPRTWIKSNPSLQENGGFLPLEVMRKKYTSAVAEGTLRAFKRYFLNMWDQSDERLIDMPEWDSGKGLFDARPLMNTRSSRKKVRDIHPDLLARFINRPCYAAVDLSLTTDFSACGFIFPVLDPDARPGQRLVKAYEVLPFFYLAINPPKITLLKRERKDGMPYTQWAEQGWIEVFDNGVIDPEEIKARLEWGGRRFKVKYYCFDPYNSRDISVSMSKAGHQNCVEVVQSLAKLNAPTKKILELVTQGRLHHGGHPVLRWHASCVSDGGNGDLLMFDKPNRARDTRRIDGMAMICTGMQQAMLDIQTRSVYAERGVLTL